MTDWKHDLPIKDHLRATDAKLDSGAAEGESVNQLGCAIASLLETLPEEVQSEFSYLVVHFRKVRNKNKCNQLLAELYDLANVHKVWLGL